MSKRKRNPYRTAEKVLAVIGYTLGSTFVLAVIGLVGWVMVTEYGWGGILLGLGTIVGFFVIVGLIAWGFYAIQNRWVKAKYAWYAKEMKERDQ